MPVLDHPVHPKTKRDAKAKNGCNNRPAMSTGYFAPDRVYKPDGTYHTILRRVPHQTSVLCKYDLWHSDLGCEGCRWMAGQVPTAKQLFNKNEECND